MFRAIVESQWKSTRGLVLLATLIAFAIPLLALQMGRSALGAAQFVWGVERVGAGYTLVALGSGLGVAMLAWSADHRGRHVYALALPVERWRYALMRYAAGASFIVPPALGILAAGGIVAASGVVPEGLHVYAVPVALRFLVASGVAFSIFFAISSATPRTAGILLAAGVSLVALDLVVDAVGLRLDLSTRLLHLLYDAPGVFSVFTGRWMLVDA